VTDQTSPGEVALHFKLS